MSWVERKKIVDWDTLLGLRSGWKQSGQVVVWTNGCFDLLHAGHVTSLVAARSLGDLLVVGINSDESVTRLKGAGHPILPEAERSVLLAALECVDYVICFNELTPETSLQRLQPEIHCKGADYAPPGGKPLPEAKVVAQYGGQIVFLPLVQAISTSEVIRRCRSLPPE